MISIDILCLDSVYAEMLALELCEAGYNAHTGRGRSCDLVICDTDTSAVKEGSLPVITFSETDKKADLVRPFLISELLSLVKERLRESEATDNGYEELYVSSNKAFARFRGEEIRLTDLEHRLLLCLYKNRKQPVGTETLMQILPQKTEDANLVRVYISYLRKKLDERFSLRFITTVRGKGYMLNTFARDDEK